MNDFGAEEGNLEARILSLNLRLSTLETLHADLSHRVDEIEDELEEIWKVLERG